MHYSIGRTTLSDVKKGDRDDGARCKRKQAFGKPCDGPIGDGG